MKTSHLPLLGLALVFTAGGCSDRSVSKARTAIDAGQPDIALSILAPVLADQPNLAPALVALGDAYVLQAQRSLEAKDDAGYKTTLAKVGEAYASAARSGPDSCLAQVRHLGHLLRTNGKLPEHEDLLRTLERCPSGDLLDAGVVSTLPGGPQFDARLPRLPLPTGEWVRLRAYDLPLEKGSSFIVVSPTRVEAVGAGEFPPAAIDPFEEGTVEAVTDAEVAFLDEGHPIVEDRTGWIDLNTNSGFCGERYTVNFMGHVRCLTTPVTASNPRPVYDDDDQFIGAKPVPGSMRCTGEMRKLESRGLFNEFRCEVTFKGSYAPLRRLPRGVVVAQPRNVAGRGPLVRLAVQRASREAAESLARGMVATGLVGTMFRTVVPECRTHPVVGVRFAGESVLRTCEVRKVGTFTFRDGLLDSWREPEGIEPGARK